MACREELERIVETIAEGIVIINQDGRIASVNGAAERILGEKRSNIIGRAYDDPAWKVTTVDGRPLPKGGHPFSEVMQTGKTAYHFEHAHEHPDGTRIIVSANAAPLYDEKGVITGIVVSLEDISQRKKAEGERDRFLERAEKERERAEKLAEEAKHRASELDTIIDAFVEPVLIYGPGGVIRRANPAAVRAHGFNPTGMKNTELAQRIKMRHPDGGEVTPDEIPSSRALRGETIVAKTLIITGVAGGDIFILTSAAPLFADEKTAGAVVIWHDITEREQRERLSNALNDINAIISSTLDFNEIIRRISAVVADALGIDQAAVVLREEGYWVIAYSYGMPKEFIGRRLTDEEAAISTLIVTSRKTVAIDDLLADPRVNKELVRMLGIRSAFGAPLVIGGEVIGVFFMNYGSKLVHITEAQIDFMTKLAAATSSSLQNARLYQAERNIANTLQEALLAVPEKVDHLEYGVLYRSATEALQVGGDFYDLFELEHNRVGLTVGDVAGKGLEAATLTAIVKNTIRAYALEGYDPAQAMARTNYAIKALASPSSFVTMIFAIFDKITRKLVYCNAGHPPAIIKRKSQTVELLEVYSPIIGAFAGLRYENGETVLGVGDTMILYTDGIIEARRESEFFRQERLVKFIRELKPISAKEVPKAIFNEVLQFSGGRLSDDVALLALAYTGQ